MTRKIVVQSLESIKLLYKEETFIVEPLNTTMVNTPLTLAASHYQQGIVILQAPEKPKPVKEGESMVEDPFLINLGDKILFDNTNVLFLTLENSEKRYLVLNKKDILLILK